MELQFTNKQIFFCLESIWEQLDYRFKYHIHQLVTANDAEAYVQDITIDRATLMQCYRAMSSGSYGCTVDMAEVLLDDLRTQLVAKGNYLDYVAYKESLTTASPLPEVIPDEYTQSLLDVAAYKEQDKAVEAAKILNGKTQILA
jgi:hypothetical protein